MSEVYLGRGARRRVLKLGKLLGEGAAGKVHALPDLPGNAAKLYHGPAEAKRHEAKIDAMLANPPDLPPALHDKARYPQIAWPEAKLYDGAGKFVGFTMPEIDFRRSTSLVNLLQKNSRRVEKLSDYYGYRVLVARNLASVFAELHRAGHHMIDMKPANLRFYPAVSWMAVVDTDGFSIAANAAGGRGRMAATQLSDEYIAPESWQKDPAELGVDQDLFALAVIIFQLLNNGVHPFAGSAGNVSQATDLQTRILDGVYPYALRPRAELQPSAASVHRMFRRSTRLLFDSAFQPGQRRPTAEEWRDHLDVLLGQLVPCAAKPDEHVHFGAGCGFCGHEARIAAARTTKPRTTRARAARPRPMPVAPQRRLVGQPLPMVRAMPRAVPLLRPPPKRRRTGWRAPAALLAAALLVYATQGVWRPLLPAGTGAAQAADVAETVPALSVAAEPDFAAFAEPRDYLVLPANGTLSVPLREGPGEDFATTERLGLHDAMVGLGTRPDVGGAQWIWVTRVSDGAAGFVPAAALMARTQSAKLAAPEAEGACAQGGCTEGAAGGNRALDARFRDLLASADSGERAYLVSSRQLWEEQRLGCNEAGDPKPCRSAIDTRWSAELEEWSRTQGVAGKPLSPALTKASLPGR